MGHWSIHIDEGEFGDIALTDLNVIILYDTPQLMFNGGWIETIYIDERANETQRQAIEGILTGRPAALGHSQPVCRERNATRYLPIHLRIRAAKNVCGLMVSSTRQSKTSGDKTE